MFQEMMPMSQGGGGVLTPKECMVFYTISNGWYGTYSNDTDTSNEEIDTQTSYTGEYLKMTTDGVTKIISAAKPCKVIYKGAKETLQIGDFNTDDQITSYRYGSTYSTTRDYAFAIAIE